VPNCLSTLYYAISLTNILVRSDFRLFTDNGQLTQNNSVGRIPLLTIIDTQVVEAYDELMTQDGVKNS